ncbi:MAG: hypothetical protein HY337_04105 [Gemmatimonadetes bacterium]|nr:hypothetical protein [Gemmatimonadota bacterium]
MPRLEAAANAADANTYSLLIAALLERGQPMTLEEAAERFAEAGIASAGRALASLKRCRPARAPIYRDGSRYALDPHDRETDLWGFRLGLRPPKAAPLTLVRPDPPPVPSPNTPLTVADLDEAWRYGVPTTWSAQRTAVCVLDAYGRAMPPDDVVAFAGRAASGARSRPTRPDTGAVGRRCMPGRMGPGSSIRLTTPCRRRGGRFMSASP